MVVDASADNQKKEEGQQEGRRTAASSTTPSYPVGYDPNYDYSEEKRLYTERQMAILDLSNELLQKGGGVPITTTSFYLNSKGIEKYYWFVDSGG